MSTYSVRSGDTLSALARRYNTTVSALAQQNHIKDPNKILVGQKLVIPSGFDAKPTKPASPPARSTGGDTFSGGSAGAGDVPLYRQGDPRWGGRALGTGSSISAAGCAMTSTAMAISTISGKQIDPGQLDKYLDSHNGYAGNGLKWGVAAQAAGLKASQQHGASLSAFDKQLAAGKPCVIGVDYKAGSRGGGNGTDHWITLTGKGTQNGKPVYYANDPATGKRITLTPENGRLVGPRGYKSTGELVTFSK